jgi:hypothetical protein
MRPTASEARRSNFCGLQAGFLAFFVRLSFDCVDENVDSATHFQKCTRSEHKISDLRLPFLVHKRWTINSDMYEIRVCVYAKTLYVFDLYDRGNGCLVVLSRDVEARRKRTISHC